jgi:hypothetical protein
MNHLTKDEIIILYEFLEHSCILNNEPDCVYDLRDKLASMIENYCEHLDYSKDEWMVCVCNKCHRIFDND